MGSNIILNFFAIVCFCIVTFTTPTESKELTIENETSKTIADKSRSTGMTNVNRMKFEVMKVTESVLSYSNYIYKRMIKKMRHYQHVCLDLIRDSHKQKLAALAEHVALSESHDHQSNDCHQSAKRKMHQQIINLQNANCSATDMAPINKFIDKIKETTKNGDHIIDYLDDVIFHCCSKDCTLFYDCINRKILRANDRIKIYRHEFKILKQTGFSVKNDETHFQCFGKLSVHILKNEIDQIYNNATQCISSHITKV